MSDVTTQPRGVLIAEFPTEPVIAVVEVATSSAVVGASTMSAASYSNHQHPWNHILLEAIWIVWNSFFVWNIQTWSSY